jgi:hypothetical protein
LGCSMTALAHCCPVVAESRPVRLTCCSDSIYCMLTMIQIFEGVVRLLQVLWGRFCASGGPPTFGPTGGSQRTVLPQLRVNLRHQRCTAKNTMHPIPCPGEVYNNNMGSPMQSGIFRVRAAPGASGDSPDKVGDFAPQPFGRVFRAPEAAQSSQLPDCLGDPILL